MATYQATAGQRLFYDKTGTPTYAMTTPEELHGVTGTPSKGGEPEGITLNIISELFQRTLIGQQELPIMAYEFVPDFSANGNVDGISDLIAKGETWIYEEYVAGTTSGGSPVLGAGVLYKGKAQSMSLGEQSGNEAQTGGFYIQLTGDSIYVSTGGATPTYTDLFTGEAVATPT